MLSDTLHNLLRRVTLQPCCQCYGSTIDQGLADELEMSSKEVSQGRKPSSGTVAGTTGGSSGLCVCSENKTSIKQVIVVNK